MHRFLRLAFILGLVPLPWFAIWTIAGGLSAPNHSILSNHASELLGVGGFPAACLTIAALGSGFGFVAFGLGVWLTSGKKFAAGGFAWILFGISMLSNGLFPMGSPLHGLYGVGVFNLVAPALSHMEAGDRLRTGGYYALTAFCSFAGIVYLWLNLTGGEPEAYRGLTQLVFSSVNSLWPFVVGFALGVRDTD